MSRVSPVTLRFWQAQAILWLLYGAIHYVATLPAVPAGEQLDVAALKAFHASVGLLLSAPMPWICQPMLTRGWRPASVSATLALVSYLLGVAWMLAERIVQIVLMTGSIAGLSIRWTSLPPAIDPASILVLFASGLAYMAVWHVNEASRHREDALREAVAAHRSRLRAMTLQLSPHFMLNTLAALRSVIAEDPAKAREMVTQLARFTRISLAGAEMLAIKDELALIDAYIAIQRVRFEHELSVQIEADETVSHCLVPALLLQPLVENAVTHGVADDEGVRHIRVSVRHAGEGLAIDVSNLGRIARDSLDSPGVGTSNTRARLAHVYGSAHDVAFTEEAGWVHVRIRIAQPLYAA